jgi:hypothetical protein
MADDSSFPLPRADIEAALARRAGADPAFGELLRRDPKAALSAHLGVELPAWLQVDVVEERPDRMVIVIPVDLAPFRRPTIDAMIGRPPRPPAAATEVTGPPAPPA